VTGILKGYTEWPGLEQVCRITRGRTIRGRASVEVVHAVTSLGAREASAADLLKLSRAHWGIENRLFCVRDVSLGEDRCRVRKGSGPQTLAALRNTAITIIRRLGISNIAAALRDFMMNSYKACYLIRYGNIK
jgi:hypothetical protein